LVFAEKRKGGLMPITDAAWRTWIETNIGRGCTVESMIEAMTSAGIDAAVAATTVEAFVARGEGATQAGPAEPVPDGYRYDACPVPAGQVIRAADRDVTVRMRCDHPQVIVFDDVMSADECEALIAQSRDRLTRSTTVNPGNGSADVIHHRTSEGVWFQRCENALIEQLDRRIAALMHWPLENGEGLQILHYQAGGEYRAHFDYFPPQQAGSALHTARGGQRVATLIVYLNDVLDGGETVFPEVGISVSARRGSAVYFRYQNSLRQLDPLTLHAGAPVRSGEKWIMTKWMRERPYV
jgi:prolyl 4-hydroxylase